MPNPSAKRHPFVGREEELAQLERVAKLPKASLIACRGRRRIGKSTLIEHFAQRFERFYEFQGLAPREQLNNRDQLENFARGLAEQFQLPAVQFQNWHEAFALLARLTEGQRALIFLDEISWMASRDADFVGQLKIAWDTRFKKNRQLILVLCGSVSSWIDRNILNGADFMGRMSLSLDLRELPLEKCNEFFSAVGGPAGGRMSALEKFRILSVTGGIPRYLEEIDYTATAEHNIAQLCFRKDGFLLSEFDRIFNDIFSKRAAAYKEIVATLADGARTFSEICKQLDVAPNGIITEYLSDLESCGFLQRDYVYSLATAHQGRLSRYRIKDNYLRFYLKCIQPVRKKVEAGLFKPAGGFSSFDAIMGLQFRNLVLNNLPTVLRTLKIPVEQIRSASPYFQNKTARQQACQIDLLIDAKYAVHVCAIKFQKRIDLSVVDEIKDKAAKLKIERGKSLRYALIYMGELAEGIEDSGGFDRLVPFEALLA